MTESVHLFSNGFEWDNWEARNCDRCVKQEACDLLDAIFDDSIIHALPHGEVLPETAKRVGYSDDYVGVLGWRCAEFQAEGPVEPTPAAIEMQRAGATMLPGME